MAFTLKRRDVRMDLVLYKMPRRYKTGDPRNHRRAEAAMWNAILLGRFLRSLK